MSAGWQRNPFSLTVILEKGRRVKEREEREKEEEKKEKGERERREAKQQLHSR